MLADEVFGFGVEFMKLETGILQLLASSTAKVLHVLARIFAELDGLLGGYFT